MVAASVEVDGLAGVRTDLGDDRLERSGGIAESTVSTISAWPESSRLTCMPPMLTPASPSTRPTMPDDAGTVVVAQERHVLADRDVDVEAVDLDELGDVARPGHGAGDADLRAVGLGQRDAQQRAMVLARAVGRRGRTSTPRCSASTGALT